MLNNESLVLFLLIEA